jgi:hypothetical protein
MKRRSEDLTKFPQKFILNIDLYHEWLKLALSDKIRFGLLITVNSLTMIT